MQPHDLRPRPEFSSPPVIAGLVLLTAGTSWGQFEPARTIAGVSMLSPRAVAVADLDGDGLDDLLIGGAQFGELSHSRGLAGGGFDAPVVLATVRGHVTAIRPFDADGDGDLDLCVERQVWIYGMVAASYRGALDIHENLGGGTFAAPRRLVERSTVLGGSAIGDVDGDGRLDIVVSVTAEDAVLWLENLGGGAFGAERVLQSLVRPERFALGDLDGDGDLDVAVRRQVDELVLLRNEGAGASFTPVAALPVGPGMSSSLLRFPSSVDLDGDGDLDLLAGETGGGASWFPNLGAFSFGAAVVVGQPQFSVHGAESTRAVDLDRDGDIDLLSSSKASGLVGIPGIPFGWYENLGSGTFSAVRAITPYVSEGEAIQIAVGDFAGDGDLDIAFTVRSFGTPPRVFTNTGGETFVEAPSPLGPVFAVPTLVVAGDIDRDGDVDLLSDIVPGMFAWHENLGGGRFAAPVASSATPVGNVVSLMDLDGDGDLDLLERGAALRLQRGDGLGGFGPSELVLDGVRDHDVGDLDGDGDPDLLVVRTAGTARLGWMRNVAGTFAAPSPLPTGAFIPTAAALFELDGDGRRDIAYLYGAGSLQVLNNLGSGSFAPGQGILATQFLWSPPQDVQAADFDGDRLDDLIVRPGLVENSVGTLAIVPGSAGGQAVVTAPLVPLDVNADGSFELLAGGLSIYSIDGPFGPEDHRKLRPEVQGGENRLGADLDGDGDMDLVQTVLGPKLVWYEQRSGTVESLCAPAGTNATLSSYGRLSFVGSTRAADDDVTLVVEDLPPSTACVLAVSDSFGELPGFRGSRGTFCLDGSKYGLLTGPGQIQVADATGRAQLRVPLAETLVYPGATSVTAGTTLGFQMWYRDRRPNGEPASNLSSAVRVSFD